MSRRSGVAAPQENTVPFVPRNALARAVHNFGEWTDQLHSGISVTMWSIAMICTTITSSFVTKWLLNEYAFGGVSGGFPYPITYASARWTLQVLITRAVVQLGMVAPVPPLDRNTFWTYVFPIAIFAAASVTMAGASLLFLDVSLYTVTRASSVVWIFIVGIFLGLEDPDFALFVATVITAIGVGASSWAEAAANAPGLLLAIGATMCSSIQWAIVQKYMKGDVRFTGTLRVKYHTSLPMTVLGWGVAATWEFPTIIRSDYADHPLALVVVGLVIVLVGFMSFLLVGSQVKLVELTSSLTLGMVSNLRNVLQVIGSAVFFDDPLTVINSIGLLLTLIGGTLYNHARSVKHARQKGYQPIATEEDGTAGVDCTNPQQPIWKDGDVLT